MQPIVQPIEIQSNQDLILRTTVDERGKTIIMKAAKSYNGFNDKITVKFPPYCVLGEEKIFLEVLPEDIVNSYNEKNSSGKVPGSIIPFRRWWFTKNATDGGILPTNADTLFPAIPSN